MADRNVRVGYSGCGNPAGLGVHQVPEVRQKIQPKRRTFRGRHGGIFP